MQVSYEAYSLLVLTDPAHLKMKYIRAWFPVSAGADAVCFLLWLVNITGLLVSRVPRSLLR